MLKTLVKNFIFKRLGNEPEIMNMEQNKMTEWLETSAEGMIAAARTAKASDEMIIDFLSKNPKLTIKKNLEIEIEL